MSIVASIIGDLGGPTIINGATGIPMTTIHSWINGTGGIPRWRRAGIMEAAQRLGKTLSAQQLAYLASSERKPDIAA